MADDRYLECVGCGAHNTIQVNVWQKAAPGDGVPWIGDDLVDVNEWRCIKCGAESDERFEVCFIGYPGITEEEKEEQMGDDYPGASSPTEPEPDELPADDFERGYFHYGVYEDEGRTMIGVTTETEWNLNGCCKDGYTEDEADRIYSVMSAIFASESMESIFEVPGHRPEEVHVAMLPFLDFARNDDLSRFLADVNI